MVILSGGKNMRVNLNRTHSPCESCWIRGVPYDPESKRCMSCEFDICVKILKASLSLICGNDCSSCEKYDTGCAAKSGECGYRMDLRKMCKRFGIEIEE